MENTFTTYLAADKMLKEYQDAILVMASKEIGDPDWYQASKAASELHIAIARKLAGM